MNKKIVSFLKAYWLIIWLVSIILAVLSLPVYSAYIRSQNVKRVISTIGGVGNRFSSNRLDELATDDTELKFRLIAVSGTVPDEGIDRVMYICNYPQGFEGSFYDLPLTYDLEAELTDNDSNPPVFDNELVALTKYYITDSEGTIHYFTNTGGKYTLTLSAQELKGNRANENEYILHFPDVDTNVYMKIFTTPKVDVGETSIKPDDLRSLGAFISAVSVEQNSDTNWIGKLIEPRADWKNVSDYDAFNYVISGSGAGNITLKWKADMLETNPYFFENEGITAVPSEPDNEGYSSLTFDVTAGQTKDRYSFQFYKTKDSSWNAVNSFTKIANEENTGSPLIKFNFTSSAQAQDNDGQDG